MGETEEVIIMRKRIVATLLCIICVLFVGCSDSTLSVGVSGDSVVVEYVDDGVRELITDEDDVKALQESFSGDYEEEKNFSKDGGEYIVYFGNNLDLELQNPEDYVNYAVFDGKAYANDGGKIYKSTEEIDLSIFDKYRKKNTELD